MKKISNTLIIPDGCTERFLHFTDTGQLEVYTGGRICGGISDPLKPGYQVVYWKNPSQEWIYIIRGSMDFHWDGKKITANSGDFVYLPSQLIPHSMSVADNDSGMIWFHVRPAGSDTAWNVPVKTPFCRKAMFFEEIHYLSELLLLQERKMDPERKNTIHQIRDYLIREVMADISANQFHLDSLLKVFEMVRKDLSRNWSVSELAQAAFLSDSHFFAVTKKCFGETPLSYIRRLRMEHGRNLLLRTDLTLNQIAQKRGYGDAYAFSKAFRSYSGKSPGAIRKQFDH